MIIPVGKSYANGLTGLGHAWFIYLCRTYSLQLVGCDNEESVSTLVRAFQISHLPTAFETSVDNQRLLNGAEKFYSSCRVNCSHTAQMNCGYEGLPLASSIIEPRPASSLTGCRQHRFCDRVFTYVQNARRAIDFFSCDGYITTSIYSTSAARSSTDVTVPSNFSAVMATSLPASTATSAARSSTDVTVPSNSSAVTPTKSSMEPSKFSANVPRTPLSALHASLAPAPTSPTGSSESLPEPLHRHQCHFSDKTFTVSRNVWRHERSNCDKNPCCTSYSCDRCGTQFSRIDNLLRHAKACKGEVHFSSVPRYLVCCKQNIALGKAVCLQPAAETRNCCPERSAIVHDRRFRNDDQPTATTQQKCWQLTKSVARVDIHVRGIKRSERRFLSAKSRMCDGVSAIATIAVHVVTLPFVQVLSKDSDGPVEDVVAGAKDAGNISTGILGTSAENRSRTPRARWFVVSGTVGWCADGVTIGNALRSWPHVSNNARTVGRAGTDYCDVYRVRCYVPIASLATHACLSLRAVVLLHVTEQQGIHYTRPVTSLAELRFGGRKSVNQQATWYSTELTPAYLATVHHTPLTRVLYTDEDPAKKYQCICPRPLYIFEELGPSEVAQCNSLYSYSGGPGFDSRSGHPDFGLAMVSRNHSRRILGWVPNKGHGPIPSPFLPSATCTVSNDLAVDETLGAGVSSSIGSVDFCGTRIVLPPSCPGRVPMVANIHSSCRPIGSTSKPVHSSHLLSDHNTVRQVRFLAGAPTDFRNTRIVPDDVAGWLVLSRTAVSLALAFWRRSISTSYEQWATVRNTPELDINKMTHAYLCARHSERNQLNDAEYTVLITRAAPSIVVSSQPCLPSVQSTAVLPEESTSSHLLDHTYVLREESSFQIDCDDTSDISSRRWMVKVGETLLHEDVVTSGGTTGNCAGTLVYCKGLESRCGRNEVRMEQRRNSRAGETGDSRENPLTGGIIWQDSNMRKSGSGIYEKFTICINIFVTYSRKTNVRVPKHSHPPTPLSHKLAVQTQFQIRSQIFARGGCDGTMPLSPRSAVRPALAFRRCSILTSRTLDTSLLRDAALSSLHTHDRELHTAGLCAASLFRASGEKRGRDNRNLQICCKQDCGFQSDEFPCKQGSYNSATVCRSSFRDSVDLHQLLQVVEFFLQCLPANRVRLPVGSLQDFRTWESRRTMAHVSGFSRGLPFPRALAFRHFVLLGGLQDLHCTPANTLTGLKRQHTDAGDRRPLPREELYDEEDEVADHAVHQPQHQAVSLPLHAKKNTTITCWTHNTTAYSRRPSTWSFFSAFEAEKRGSLNGATATRIKSPIISKRKALNWRAVFSSYVYLWDFQQLQYYFIGGKANPLRLLGRKIMQGDMHRDKEGLGSHGLHFGAMTTSLSVLRAREKPSRKTLLQETECLENMILVNSVGKASREGAGALFILNLVPAVTREVFGRLSGGRSDAIGPLPPISYMDLKTKGEKVSCHRGIYSVGMMKSRRAQCSVQSTTTAHGHLRAELVVPECCVCLKEIARSIH
ncbi:hypothetical protein PR048_024577 [Dryococelus australis]|uniref:C2H2-type domain-containing protein n=1 Tax=Dryococelus australis TaxID=614101 RepID=A0ABQ9GP14_9NEOP|nr:hypothetical protein PR048_024577 [Dryococelus australis]